MNLPSQFGIDTGNRDFAGTALPQAAGYDIGAVERLTLPGDANRDGVVNFADLLAVARNYNTTGRTWADGDFTGDGLINFADLLIVARNYNRTASAPPPAPAPTSAPRNGVARDSSDVLA